MKELIFAWKVIGLASSFGIVSKSVVRSVNPQTYTLYCSPSYCECDCNRDDCNCEEKEKYIKLHMSCPAVKKIDNSVVRCPGGNKPSTDWTHSKDDYHLWISNHANVRCEKSHCSTNKMQNWKFKCAEHSFHEGQYLSTTSESWINVVTAAGRIWGDGDLVLELLIWLQKNKF